jgi:hypothetical protein
MPVFLVNDKNCTDLNFSHFFCELGLKMLGPQASTVAACESCQPKRTCQKATKANKVNIVP